MGQFSPAIFTIFEILDRKFTEETLIQDSELLAHARKIFFTEHNLLTNTDFFGKNSCGNIIVRKKTTDSTLNYCQ